MTMTETKEKDYKIDFSKISFKPLKEMIDGKPVNKNPLVNISKAEMRLYYVDDNYFESIDELLKYCRINNVNIKELNILDYYRELAGRKDVILKSNSKIQLLYSACDEYGFGIYNGERSFYKGEFVWEYIHGSIENLYKPFRDKGIKFENDIYEKIRKDDEQILKYCQNNHLFNM